MIIKLYRASIAFMWLILAICSALFAALTSILAKIGIDGVDSTLATAIRTVVVVLLSWGMVFITNTQNGILEISKKSWIFLIFLVIISRTKIFRRRDSYD